MLIFAIVLRSHWLWPEERTGAQPEKLLVDEPGGCHRRPGEVVAMGMVAVGATRDVGGPRV